MLTADTKLISVDDHVVEPPGVFVDHIAPRYRDRAPRIIEPEPGVQGWEWEGRFYPLSFQGNVHTRRFRAGEEGKGDDLFARHYDDMIPAAYDVHERVRAMDEDGVWAELLFPTFPRFGGNRFLEADDPDLALACVQAWNDWMLDEWCAAYPDRFIPQTLIPLWDTAARGARDRAVRGEGLEGDQLRREPVPDRVAVVPDRSLGSGVRGRGRHRPAAVDAHRHVVGAALTLAGHDADRSASRCAA